MPGGRGASDNEDMLGADLDGLIRRARRRWLRNLLLRAAILAGCVAAAGLMVLLLAGAQVLDWRWPASLLAAGLVYGLGRAARRIPSPYQVSQAVDRNLDWHDASSTACFYSRMGGEGRSSEEMRTAQLAAAEALCPEADLRRAVPWRTPRSAYVAIVLVLAAAGLFALRYGFARRLELTSSLPRIVLDTMRPPVQRQAARDQRTDRRVREYWQHFGVSLEDVAGAGERVAASTGQEADPDRYSPEGVRPLELSAGQEANEGAEGPGDRLSLGTGEEKGQPSGAARGGESGPEDRDSLLEKFRDAFANLLNRLKIQPQGGETQQAASSAMSQSEAAQGRQSPTQKGMPGSGRELSEGTPGAQAQEMQPGEGAQKSPSAPGRRGQEGESEAAREGRGGIGSEDGSKQLREAEQLAAMGKISELIGKRSQNLTGEVMVEVTSGRQQLRTAYSQQQAAHAEAGGAIHRDEIPLAYQSYVERYFEQVRQPTPQAARPQK